jgi:8-oxo-dGTP pyrophosphatase MutT (NUDIX family)
MTQPVNPVDACTVVVAREGMPAGEPWQVFMVRRHVRSDFAADVFVFPGGKVDAGDRDPELLRLVDGHPSPLPEGADIREWTVYGMTAIREMFEEAGILLARSEDGTPLDLLTERAERFDKYRLQIQAGAVTMLDMARTEKLRFMGDALHPLSRWVTPESFPRRFDTRFFVARMPERQLPIHDRAETTESTWIAPDEALDRYDEGSFPLVYATEMHLRRMEDYETVDDLIASIDSTDLSPVMPKPITRDGVEEFLLPGDPGYADA